MQKARHGIPYKRTENWNDNMHRLNGLKVLFISPDFLGIDKSIMKSLTDKGADVTWIDERSVKSSFGRAMNSAFPGFFDRHSDKDLRKNNICIMTIQRERAMV